MAPYDKASTKVLLMCGPFAVTRGTPHFCTTIEAVGKHLNALGFNASVFDASLPERLSGCFEHPNTCASRGAGGTGNSSDDGMVSAHITRAELREATAESCSDRKDLEVSYYHKCGTLWKNG
eukprot:COSAG02_NODE_8048_length_2733_cov_2.066819_2_plen_122_part_00